MTDNELRTLLAARLASVHARIDVACARAQRDPAGVTVVAVTKTVSPRVARLIAELGVLDLGESRPQELWRKAEALKDLPIRWNLVGHLQRNKVERTLPLVHMIQSVDSVRLLQAIADEGRMRNTRPRVLLQVNASHEQQKHGFDDDELVRSEPEVTGSPVDLLGLMTMAAYSEVPDLARPAFVALRTLRDRLRSEWNMAGTQLQHLSMGMSGDFEVAVEEGATIVRLGTTLFEGLEAE